MAVLDELVVRFTGDAERYTRTLQQMEAQTKAAAGAITQVSRQSALAFADAYKAAAAGIAENARAKVVAGLNAAAGAARQTGAALSAGVTAPVAGLGGLAVKEFMTLEQAMANLSAAGNVTGAQLGRVKESVKELSMETGVAPEKVAQIFSELIKAGASVEQVLGGLGRQAVQFAQVSGMETAQASVILVDSMNIFKREGVNASQVMNAMNQAADSTTASLSDMAMAFRAGAPIMALYGQTMQDTATSLAVLAESGQKGSLAGTALKTLMGRLSSGTDTAAKAFKTLGTNFRDADKNLLPMRDIIAILEDAKGRLDPETFQKMTFDLGQQRGATVIAALLKGGVKGWDEMQQKMQQSLSVEKKFEIVTNTTQGAVNRLWASIKVLAGEVGEILAPYFQEVARWAAMAVTWFRGLDLGTQKLIVVIALAAAAAGPLLLALGMLPVILGPVITLFGVLKAAFLALISPAGLVTMAVIAYVGSILYFTGLGEFLLGKLGQAWAALVTHVQPAIDGVKAALKAGDLGLAFNIVWTEIQLGLQIAVTKMKSLWSNFVAAVKFSAADVGAFTDSMWTRMAGGLQVVIHDMQRALNIGDANAQTRSRVLADIATNTEAHLGEIERKRQKRQADAMDADRKEQARLQAELDALMKKRNNQIDAAVNAPELLPMPKEEELKKSEEDVKREQQNWEQRNKTVKAGLEKVDAVAVQSAEAYSRIAAFSDDLLGRNNRLAREGTFDAASAFGAEGNQRYEKQQVELLKRLLEETKRKGPGVNVEDADL